MQIGGTDLENRKNKLGFGNASIQLPYADLTEAWTIIGGERLGVVLQAARAADQPSTPYPVARAPLREHRNVVDAPVGAMEDNFQLTQSRRVKA